LESLLQGTPADVLFQAALTLGAATVRDTLAKSRLEPEIAQAALKECLETGMIIALEDPANSVSAESLLIPAPHWASLQASIKSALTLFHEKFPLRRGMPREELKSRLKLAPRLFNTLLKFSPIQDGGAWLASPGHTVRFSTAQQVRIDALLRKFAAAPFAPPSVKECQSEAGEDVFAALIELGELVLAAPEVVFARADFEKMTVMVREKIAKDGQTTAAEVRDIFGTSRKFALAVLEHLDGIGVTIRDGDVRRLRRP
jgi:selenocysteine-specific elongation factor